MAEAMQAMTTAADEDRRAPVRVLLVDADDVVARRTGAALTAAGMRLHRVASGAEAVAEVRRFDPRMVLLDPDLPDLPGADVFRRVVRPREVPCILLSARDGWDDVVAGLQMGADDYLAKPFSTDELLARVRVVLRRCGVADQDAVIAVGDVVLDDEARRVTCRGHEVPLTPTEFTLLRFLLGNAGRVVSKRQILEHVWAYDFGGQANIVEIYVSYLRRKLGRWGTAPIETVRGFGYVAHAPHV